MESKRYDTAVIGGGPAGAIAAATLARAGQSVVLLERDRFPRFHIGESLLPLARPVFEDVGVWDRLAGEGFTRKSGATFVTADGEKQYRADFSAALPAERAGTFHVARSRFDELLLRHAEETGVEVREECRAGKVEFHDDRVDVEVNGELLGADALIDASGRQGVLAKRLDLRVQDPDLRRVAAYAHFRNVPQLEGATDGDIVLVSRPDLSWLWFIPLAGGVMSVGAVFDRTQHESGSDPGRTLQRYLADSPVTAELMRHAERIGDARYEGDFSYSVRQYCGDRWLLAGDAGSFLDPIFSTGVQLAVQSGWEAAQAVLTATPKARKQFDRIQRRRYVFFRKFVAGFYDPHFRDLFFQPNRSKGIYRAIVNVLAGSDRPDWKQRIAIGTFMLLARLQRRFALVPRLHANGHARPPAS